MRLIARVLALVLVAALSNGCAGMTYEKALEKNTIAGYKQFIAEHPDSEFSLDAEQKLQDITLEEALEKDDIESYERYLYDYPNGKYVSDVREKLDERYWEEVLENDDIESYEKYLYIEFPDGKFVSEARERLHERYWEGTQKTKDVASYEKYLAEFPDGKYALEAREKLREKLHGRYWEDAKAYDTTTAFKEFLQEYPDSEYVGEAKIRIEHTEWKRIQFSTRVSDYRSFLREYPRSQFVIYVQKKISGLHTRAWADAQKSDHIDGYEGFLALYPDSEHFNKAKERRDWLIANRAIVKVEFPKTVKGGGWQAVFKETGGKAGFKLSRSEFSVSNGNGHRWTNSRVISVTVKPGGSAIVSFGFSMGGLTTPNNGGDYRDVWEGYDDWGNKISVRNFVDFVE